MKATEQLRNEHRGIEVMLDILAKVCGRLQAGGSVDPQHLAEILEFFTVFVDKCHHAKEEDLLFPAMEQAGIPGDTGQMGGLLGEHAGGPGVHPRHESGARRSETG